MGTCKVGQKKPSRQERQKTSKSTKCVSPKEKREKNDNPLYGCFFLFFILDNLILA